MGKRFLKTLASSVLSKFEDSNEYHFHDIDRKWIIEAMLVFAEIYTNEREGKETPDENSNCIKHAVSQQREQLLAFTSWLYTDGNALIFQNDAEQVDEYLKANNCG